MPCGSLLNQGDIPLVWPIKSIQWNQCCPVIIHHKLTYSLSYDCAIFVHIVFLNLGAKAEDFPQAGSLWKVATVPAVCSYARDLGNEIYKYSAIPTFSQATVCLDPVRSPFFWTLIYSLTEQSYVVPHCFEFPSSNRSQSITLTSTLALALTNSIVAHSASSELLLSIFYSLLKLHFLKT